MDPRPTANAVPSLAAIAGAFLAAAASTGCANKQDDGPLAKVDAPIAAEIVIDPRAPLRNDGSVGEGTVLVLKGASPEKFVVAPGKLAKGDVAIAEEGGGARIAVRKAGAWLTFFRTADGHVFRADGEKAGGTTVDWSALPTFDDAAPGLYVGVEPTQRGAVVDEVKLRGAAVIEKVVTATLDAPYAKATGEAGWNALFAALPPEGRARVAKAAADRVRGDAALAKIDRAVDVLDPGATDLADPVAARLAGLPLETPSDDERTAAVLLRDLTRWQKDKAAEIGCAILQKTANDRGNVGPSPARQHLADAALVAVAHAKAACPAVAKILVAHACDARLRCDHAGEKLPDYKMALCDPKEIGDAIEAEVATPTAPPGPDRYPLESMQGALGRRALAASYAHGDAPEALIKGNARRLYDVDAPASPDCGRADAGVACRCPEFEVRNAACHLAPTETKGKAVDCEFTVNDAARKIGGVRAVPHLHPGDLHVPGDPLGVRRGDIGIHDVTGAADFPEAERSMRAAQRGIRLCFFRGTTPSGTTAHVTVKVAPGAPAAVTVTGDHLGDDIADCITKRLRLAFPQPPHPATLTFAATWVVPDAGATAAPKP